MYALRETAQQERYYSADPQLILEDVVHTEMYYIHNCKRIL
jgi:hypothetical protein